MREVAGYITLFRSRDNIKRVWTAWLVMFWQQWTGIDSSRPALGQLRALKRCIHSLTDLFV